VFKNLLLLLAITALSACAGQQITRVQELSDSADAPYKNVLVISLFELFDSRRYLEQEIVRELSARGINAVASTSMMDSRTPVTRETFLAMVDEHESDAVIVTTLMSLNSKSRVLDASPEATYNIRPTYYFNVWSVDLDEYVGPQDLEQTHTFVLSTQVYSASTKEPVWAIESKTSITRDHQNRGDTTIFADEAKAIANHLSRDHLLAR
jgi:hypothetical protein